MDIFLSTNIMYYYRNISLIAKYINKNAINVQKKEARF